MPYFNLGKKNIELKVIDDENVKNKDCFIKIILNIYYLKAMFKELKLLSVSEVPSDVVMSDREIEVLEFMAKGMNNKSIASEMNISIHTVKVHIHNIFTKLSVNDRTLAVIKAIKANLLKI